MKRVAAVAFIAFIARAAGGCTVEPQEQDAGWDAAPDLPAEVAETAPEPPDEVADAADGDEPDGDAVAPGPPPAPGLTDEPDYNSGGNNRAVTLAWSAVAAPDGDPVEYLVQVGASASLTSPAHESEWIADDSWSVTLTPGGTWFWRVRARDAAHHDQVSEWSRVDTFYDTWSPGSCPFLFVWDGGKYEYLTDIQGAAIGLPASVLTTKNMRHYRPEHIVLDGLARGADGRYRVKIRETMTEITYVDELALVAVDLPEGSEVVSSTAESTYSYGYAEPFRVITTGSGMRRPVAAVDDRGGDVLGALLAVDDRVAGSAAGGDRWYELDFGAGAATGAAKDARLVIDGWTIYDRDRFGAAELVQPYVEVPGPGGGWVTARAIGNVAGDLKRMAIDLSGLFPGKERRVRIHTGRVHAINWFMDRVALDETAPVPFATVRLGAVAAVLRHGGRVPYVRASDESRTIAEDASFPDNPAAGGYGAFTRHGKVLPLVTAADDMHVVMRHGDELVVTFPGDLPPPAEGMHRVYVLEALLYYKHLGGTKTVDPLPYAGMERYPFTAAEATGSWGYPMDAAHKRYLKKYNTRTCTPKPAKKKKE